MNLSHLKETSPEEIKRQVLLGEKEESDLGIAAEIPVVSSRSRKTQNGIRRSSVELGIGQGVTLQPKES